MKIFKMNEFDWVAAETLEEATKCLAENLSNGIVDDDFKNEFIDSPHELDDLDMQRLKFGEGMPIPKITFKAELEKRIKNGEDFPQHFASMVD